ncbi:MAG: MFS transporter [Gemmataceae bacterium]|nr:MFS transporter [Gemmataceae bacterium]
MSSHATKPDVPPPQPFTFQIWLILIIASIGFAFDIYELLMLPLILRPALTDFGIPPTDPRFKMWVGLMFYVPAIAGGIFGLLGGYMTDRFGRRSVLTWSILLYAVSAFLAGFSTSPLMLLVLRCTTFIGVCVEFVAAVAWLAELFPNPEQRENVLGYTQAFSSIGGLLVATANSLAVALAASNSLPAVAMPEFLVGLFGQITIGSRDSLPWRYTLMSGLIPAIPLILIRPFLPESPAWAKKKAEGTLKRPSIAGLFSPQLRTTTIVTMIMFACSYGAAFGAIQQMPQIAPGLTEDVDAYEKKIKEAEEAKNREGKLAPPQEKMLADIRKGIAEREEEKDAGKRLSPSKMDEEAKAALQKRIETARRKLAEQKLASDYTKIQEIGGLLGRFLLASLAVVIVSRRGLLRLFQVPGLLVMPLFFWYFLTIPNTKYFSIPLDALGLGTLPVTNVSLGMALAGFFTVGQFSFWGNYLPRVYPVHLRGTGESFAANIGGRLIGTSFAAVTVFLAGFFVAQGATAVQEAAAFAKAAAIVAGFVYVVGFIASFFLPEPKGEMED